MLGAVEVMLSSLIADMKEPPHCCEDHHTDLSLLSLPVGPPCCLTSPDLIFNIFLIFRIGVSLFFVVVVVVVVLI